MNRTTKANIKNPSLNSMPDISKSGINVSPETITLERRLVNEAEKSLLVSIFPPFFKALIGPDEPILTFLLPFAGG